MGSCEKPLEVLQLCHKRSSGKYDRSKSHQLATGWSVGFHCGFHSLVAPAADKEKTGDRGQGTGGNG
jgi:hypothetical protein